MKYKHQRDQARGTKQQLSFSEQLDRWGSTELTASLAGKTVATISGLQSQVAVKAARRQISAELGRALKASFSS